MVAILDKVYWGHKWQPEVKFFFLTCLDTTEFTRHTKSRNSLSLFIDSYT